MTVTFRTRPALAALFGTAIACFALAAPGLVHSAQTTRERGRLAFSHALPRLDGGHLQVKLVDVAYAPGESSPPHTHPCPIVGYVLEGAVRMRVNGSAEAIYKAGQGFYEEANGRHLVSANVSRTERARFLAYFTCDHDAPLSTPIHDAGR